MENWLQPKTTKELEKQLNQTETILGDTLELDLLKDLEIEEIKRHYPERYQVYLTLVRSKKNKKEILESELKEMKDWIRALNNLDEYVEDHKINEKERILRARQFTVFEDIRASLERGEKEGYVKLPTGMGKTVLFSQVLEALKLKTLVVVPSKILVNQTGEKLEEFTDAEFGKYYQNVKDLSKNVTVITYSSLLLAIERGELNPKEFGALILDEVHKGLGDKTVEAINRFDCMKLGFTATPEYSKKKHVEKLLEHKIHEMTIIEAVREGLISRFKSVFAYTETDLSQVPVTRGGEYNEEALEKAINNTSRNLSAVQLYKEMFSGQSSVAYCGGVAHATDLTLLFKEHGVSAEVISGKTPPEERKIILEKFKNGEIQVLCNAKLLIEGFDEPRATVALNLHPTLSQVDAEQRAGRVLRLDKNNPDKWGYIVDFIDKNSSKDAVTFPEIARAAQIQYRASPEIFDEITRKRMDADLEVETGTGNMTRPKIEGLNVIVDAQEILSISKEYSDSRVELGEALPGWLNANQIRVEFQINHQQVQNLAERYRNDYPAWFRDFKGKTGVGEHYHPDLIKKIVADYEPFRLVEKLPSDWLTLKALTTAAGASYKTIENEVNKYRISNPDWFKIGKSDSHKILEHFSPEISKKVVEEIKKGKPKEGWFTASTLRDILHVSDATIKKFVELYRGTNPDWFEDARSGGMGKISEHYHPELIKQIKDKFSKSEIITAPSGWMTPSQLSIQYGYDYATIKRQGEIYRSEHPEWFNEYKTTRKVAEHYHPDLVKKITEWYEEKNNTPYPPEGEGWMTAYALALELKRDTLKMKALAAPYRKTHPDWFMEFRAGKSMIAEHYHPDLIKAIREDFKISRK